MRDEWCLSGSELDEADKQALLSALRQSTRAHVSPDPTGSGLDLEWVAVCGA